MKKKWSTGEEREQNNGLKLSSELGKPNRKLLDNSYWLLVIGLKVNFRTDWALKTLPEPADRPTGLTG